MLKYVPWNWLVCIEPRFLKLIPDDLKIHEMFKKPLKKRHGCCTMFLFTSGHWECVAGLLKNVYTLLDLSLTILRNKKCVKKLFKKTHSSQVISRIFLKPKGCVKKLLKMNQKPQNICQTILRQKRYVKRQCAEDHRHWACP